MAGFSAYLVQRGAARDVKLRRLTGPEKAAFLLGMLSIARGSDPPGRLMVGLEQATIEDIAYEADVDERDADRAITKLLNVGVLSRDADGLYITRWADHQPAPRVKRPSDAPERTRERKQRSRDENAELDVPPLSTRRRDQDARRAWIEDLAAEMYPDPAGEERAYVKGAIGDGATTKKTIRAYVARWTEDAA